MIPRYQRILFWILAGSILLMALFLLRGCEQAHQRLSALKDATPIEAPVAAEAQNITFDIASDADGSISPVERKLALPQEPTIRARSLLEHLLAEYALPASTHPLPSGASVDDVFLVSLPLTSQPSSDENDGLGNPPPGYSGQVAVINLRSSFTSVHPSGVLVEDLTVQSIIGTLHANIPEISQIQFLVDGQKRDTLAGHANLRRTYLATDTTQKPTVPRPIDESPTTGNK